MHAVDLRLRQNVRRTGAAPVRPKSGFVHEESNLIVQNPRIQQAGKLNLPVIKTLFYWRNVRLRLGVVLQENKVRSIPLKECNFHS